MQGIHVDCRVLDMGGSWGMWDRVLVIKELYAGLMARGGIGIGPEGQCKMWSYMESIMGPDMAIMKKGKWGYDEDSAPPPSFSPPLQFASNYLKIVNRGVSGNPQLCHGCSWPLCGKRNGIRWESCWVIVDEGLVNWSGCC